MDLLSDYVTRAVQQLASGGSTSGRGYLARNAVR
jgi:hypothetical protein